MTFIELCLITLLASININIISPTAIGIYAHSTYFNPHTRNAGHRSIGLNIYASELITRPKVFTNN